MTNRRSHRAERELHAKGSGIGRLPGGFVDAARRGVKGIAGDVSAALLPAAPVFQKFTSQEDMGHFLEVHYKIRTPKDLTSCEVCHR